MTARTTSLALLLVVTSAAAQRTAPADTTRGDSTRPYDLGSVIVRTQSIVSQAASSARPTSILTREAIESAQARDASDAVALAPGAFVRQYGGAGGLRTLSLRGASAQQSVLLIDGIRYQSSASGAADLGSIPAALLRRVEVVRGGQASRYGSSALGGAVNLVTASPLTVGYLLNGRADVGSFGERAATVSATAALPRGAVDASLTYTASDGDYPFAYREYGAESVVRRSNADLSSLFGRASWRQDVDSTVRAGLTVIGFDTRRGVPGAIVQGHHEQELARLEERELFAVARADVAGRDWLGTVAASSRANRLEYADPQALSNGPGGIDNAYDRVELSVLARVQGALGSDGSVEAGAEVAHAKLVGDNLDPATGGSVERLQWSASASAAWLARDVLELGSVALDVAARADGFSDLALALSPSLAVVLRPLDGPLRLRSHIALGYRAPTFSEQYYLNYGNTDLRPEHSLSVDAGATLTVTDALLVEATAFAIDTRDQIISVPRSPVVWSAQNVASTLTRGIELGLSGELLDGRVAINMSYTRMRAEDRTEGPTYGRLLVYSPEEVASAFVEWRPRPFALGVVAQSISHRHTLSSNDPAAALPRYTTIGAHVSARMRWQGAAIVGRVEGFNLLDAQYQVVRNYPMPGRSLRFGVEVSYASE